MDSIVNALSDPGAWVSGILFSFIATVIYKSFGLLLPKVRGLSRARKLKNIKRLRAGRVNPMAITYAIGKANAQYLAFLLMCFFYLGALLVSSSFRDLINYSVFVGLLIGSPIFIFEFVWLFQDAYAAKLVKEHAKILSYRRLREMP